MVAGLAACHRLWQTSTFQGLYRLLFYKKLWLFDALSKAMRGTREAVACLARTLFFVVVMAYSLLYCPLAEDASPRLSESLSSFHVLVLRVPLAVLRAASCKAAREHASSSEFSYRGSSENERHGLSNEARRTAASFASFNVRCMWRVIHS